MGYTHYFEQKKTVEQEKWNDYCEEVRFLLSNIVAMERIVLQPDVESDHEFYEINENFISFNGDGSMNLDHETFYINRKKDPSTFLFCKTNRKPYDLAVCGCLILAHKHLPGYFNISSDGGSADWEPALNYLEDVFGEKFEIPFKKN